MSCWRTTTEQRVRASLLGAVLLGAGCGYKLAGTGALPDGIECLHVDAVINQSSEMGLEIDLAKGLENEVARRGFACGAGKIGGTLSATIDSLELAPAILRDQGRTGIASYELRVVARARVEVAGRRAWESGAVLEIGALTGQLESAGQAGMTAEVPGRVGLERKGGIQRAWAEMSSDIAARLIQRLTSDL